MLLFVLYLFTNDTYGLLNFCGSLLMHVEILFYVSGKNSVVMLAYT